MSSVESAIHKNAASHHRWPILQKRSYRSGPDGWKNSFGIEGIILKKQPAMVFESDTE